MNKGFFKAHWLGLCGLALLAFLMCFDGEISSEVQKVDADGEYTMTRTFGTRRGDLFFSAIGKQADEEPVREFHLPSAGSLWFEWRRGVGEVSGRFPLWLLFLGTIAGMAIASAWPKGKPPATTPATPAPNATPAPIEPAAIDTVTKDKANPIEP
jgi:hypothetical protein